MASKEGWRNRLTQADLANWRAAYDRWAERDAEEWAMSPRNPSVAQKMYPPGMRHLIPDAERGYVSKLGGQAVSAQQTKGRN
jgi:hypothetical protein